jgi:hypothetical protein
MSTSKVVAIVTTDQLLTKLSNAVSYAYRHDGTSPSVVISTLKDRSIYASIVRYNNGATKKVVCKSKSNNLFTVLNNLSEEFLGTLKSEELNPVDSLRNTLAKN